MTFLATDRRLGRSVALMGADNGKYPSGNSLLVQGSEGVVLTDPSTTIHDRGGAPVAVDRLLVSHAHEDHVAGLGCFPAASVHVHHEDAPGLWSLDGLMAVYGMAPEIEARFRPVVEQEFHYCARPDAIGFADAEVFDVGGATVTVVHLAGHTRGHCGFLVEPDGVLFVGDIDLSSFGPYYGDHWSDLADFERSIAKVRELDARWYVTSHHKGVIEGRAAFVEALDAFAAVIDRREAALLAYLAEPHTIEEIVAHRFVYRPGAEVLFADAVERRTALLHLDRLLSAGGVIELEPGRFRTSDRPRAR